MHVLHGTWVPEARLFVLWGENTAVDPRTRFSKRAKIAPHPYDLGFDALLNYVAELAPKAQPDGGDVTIWLPGAGKLTQPSPEARAAGLGDPEGTIQLLRWRVEALTLRPYDALELLIRLPARVEAGAGLALGGDLRFWQQAALLVLHALIEQRYAPTLEQQSGGRLVAGWLPDLEPGLLAGMARNMPPLCRALAPDPASAPQPLPMIEHFLQTGLDAFIRRVGARVPSARLPRLARAPWLKALIGEDRRLAANAPEAKKTYETWQGWRGLAETAATGAGAGAFRVCFRLEDPTETDPEQEPVWGLSYLLQAADDPSLLIDAATVWRSRGKTLTYLERRFDQPHERLLAALGVAARFFSPVERSLRSAKPTGVPLSSEEAYRFFSEPRRAGGAWLRRAGAELGTAQYAQGAGQNRGPAGSARPRRCGRDVELRAAGELRVGILGGRPDHQPGGI
jgi:hypothetical protein